MPVTGPVEAPRRAWHGRLVIMMTCIDTSGVIKAPRSGCDSIGCHRVLKNVAVLDACANTHCVIGPILISSPSTRNKQQPCLVMAKQQFSTRQRTPEPRFTHQETKNSPAAGRCHNKATTVCCICPGASQQTVCYVEHRKPVLALLPHSAQRIRLPYGHMATL
jgi:hypothetical protein